MLQKNNSVMIICNVKKWQSSSQFKGTNQNSIFIISKEAFLNNASEKSYTLYSMDSLFSDNMYIQDGSVYYFDLCRREYQIIIRLDSENKVINVSNISDYVDTPIESEITTKKYINSCVDSKVYNGLNYNENLTDIIITTPESGYTFILDSSSNMYVSNNQNQNTSTATITVQSNTGGGFPYALYYEIDTEENYDKFKVVQSNNTLLEISGKKSGYLPLESFTVTDSPLIITYTKDSSASSGEDTAKFCFKYANETNINAQYLNCNAVNEVSYTPTLNCHPATKGYVDKVVPSNLLNGSSEGSLRSAKSQVESDTYSMGDYSVALGMYTKATDSASFAIGNASTASGYLSFASGYDTVAAGSQSHVEGYKSSSPGDNSHAEGNYSRSEGKNSHAEGYSSRSIGESSHAEGYNTHANGNYSHAEGSSVYADGIGAHAEGYETHANGNYSHAEGCITIATSEYQHVQGKFNIEDTQCEYIHIVGNGETNETRSNAHTIDMQGNCWYSGIVKIGGSSFSDSNAKTLATQEYIDNIVGNIETLLSQI